MPGVNTWVLKPLNFALSTLLCKRTKAAYWEALLTPRVVNLRTNQISIGISQPLESLITRYEGEMSRVSLLHAGAK